LVNGWSSFLQIHSFLTLDPDVMEKSGRVWTVTDLADDYNFVDIDGKHLISISTVMSLL